MLAKDVDLVGRAGEREALAGAAKTLRSGSGALVAVRGESGAGKSRLLGLLGDLVPVKHQRFAAAAHRLEVGMPYRVMAEALGCEPTSDHPLRSRIGRKLRGRGDDGIDINAVPELRAEVFDLLVELVEDECRSSPTLLVLDDLQWADLGSLAVVDALERRLHGLPLFVAVAHQQATDDDVAAALDELSAAARTIDLAPLTENEVADLAEARLGQQPDRSLQQALSAAGGNPLLVLELLDALVEAGALEGRGGEMTLLAERWTIPPSELLLRRLRGLDVIAREIVTLAAVLGSGCSLNDLAAVSGRSTVEVVAAVRAARRHRILADDNDTLAFRHELVREAVASQLTESERLALHTTAAQALADAEVPPERVAVHLALAPSGTLPDDADWLLRAARRVRSTPQLAINYAELALERCHGDELLRTRIVEELATAHCWAGRPESAAHAVRAALARLGEASPERASQRRGVSNSDDGHEAAGPTHEDRWQGARTRIPALRRVLARALTLQGHPAEAAAALDAVDGDEDDLSDHLQLRIDATLARLIALDVDGAAATVRSLDGVRDDPTVTSATAAIESMYATLQGRGKEAVAAGQDAVLAAEGDPLAQRYRPYLVLAQAQVIDDDPDAALASLERDRELAERYGAAWGTAVHHSVLAGLHLRVGHWDDTVAEASAGLRWANDHHTRLGVPWLHSHLAQVAARRGDLDAASAHLAAAETELTGGARMGLDGVWWTKAVLAEYRGEADAAVDALGGLWQLLIGTGFTGRCSLVGPDLVRIAVAADCSELAAEVCDRLDSLAATCDTVSAQAAANRARGLFAGDLSLLDSAVERYRQAKAPTEAAWAAGEAATVAAAAGDVEDATTRARAVVGELQTRAATGEIDLLLGRLRAHDVRLRRRRRASAPTTGWEALTDTEWSVARLTADGRTNREVGEHLHMSPRTVETHLTHIFRKVGVSSRVELAVAVAGRQERER